MNEITGLILVSLLGYLIGGINLSYILSRLRGYDIRKHGSGNAGASNVVIMMGKKWGLIVALVDIFKAYIVCTVAMRIYPENPYVCALAGTATMLGHIFPIYMKFKGGKGLATLGGTILANDPKMFLVLLAIAVFLAVVTNYICVVPMTISVVFAVVYGLTRQSVTGAIILMIAAICINFKHIENLRRIKAGTEARFSLLWNRKAEAERLGKVYDDGKGYDNVEDKE